MNRYFLIAALLLIANVANAQFSLGLRGGLNFTSLPSKSYQINDDKIEALPDYYSGFHVGAVSLIQLDVFFIQPELLFLNTGTQMRYIQSNESPDVYYIQKFSRLDIPVLFGAKTGSLRVGIGPVASIVLNNSNNLTSSDNFTSDDSLKEKFNRATYGYQIGVGLNVGNLLFDLKYEASLSNLSEEVTIGNASFPFDTRPRQIIFSIGLLLF